MESQQEIVTRKIEDGSYFAEARKWYSALYIGPISERIFFIVVSCISLAIFGMGVLALMYLMPIKPRVPFVYSAKNIIDEIPSMIRLKEPDEPVNPAIINYYLATYTKMREAYSEGTFLSNRAFVKAYSDPSVFNEYNRVTHPDNPRSLIRLHGRFADVKVTVHRIVFDRSQQPYRATVDFMTEEVGTNNSDKRNWTATINFFYTDLVEHDVIDPKTGEFVLNFDEPTFQVVSYDATEQLGGIR